MIKVLIKYENNKNSIIKEYRHFLNKEDFFDKFVKKYTEENYSLEFNNNVFLILKKEENIIRCLYIK